MTTSYHCDNVTQEFDDSQIAIVKTWIEKRDSALIEKDNRIDSLNTEVTELKAQISTANDSATDLQKRIDSLEGQVTTLQAELDKRNDANNNQDKLKARRQLERLVCSRLDGVSDNDLDSLSDRGLKEKVITAYYDFKDLPNRSDESIDGMFDIAIAYSDAQKFDAKKKGMGAVAIEEEENCDDDLAFLQKKADMSRKLTYGGKK
jgi:chromosome segregation ATPase